MTIDIEEPYDSGCEGCGDLYAELDPVELNGRIIMLCDDCIEAME